MDPETRVVRLRLVGPHWSANLRSVSVLMKMMLMCQCRMGSRRSVAAMVGMNILISSILLPVPMTLLDVPDLVTGQCRMDIPEGAVALLDHVWLAVGKRKSWRLVFQRLPLQELAVVVCKVRKRPLEVVQLEQEECSVRIQACAA